MLGNYVVLAPKRAGLRLRKTKRFWSAKRAFNWARNNLTIETWRIERDDWVW